MLRIFVFTFLFFIFQTSYCSDSFPKHWWKSPINEMEVIPSWEILPEKGEVGKSVILSKRNELGILSNFAATPFVYEGKKYASIEGVWQSMKYPEGKWDNRYGKDKLPFSREQVEQMVGFEAKKAGSLASELMKKHQINYVTFAGQRMIYKTQEKGIHYQLIKNLMKEKLAQNKEVQRILVSTDKLILLPDHHSDSTFLPPAWQYNEIWMELRSQL